MDTPKLLAFALIALGLIAFAYQGITYKTQDNVLDVGPIHITAAKSHTLPVPPVVGAVALLVGVVLLMSRKG
jgi:hypothetical protein